MADYIAPLQTLIEQFRKLPGVGNKTAVRYALSVLRFSEEDTEHFADAVIGAKRDVHTCSVCHNYATTDLCPICADPERDRGIICVVEDAQDVMAIERLRGVKWTYHVLGGTLNPRKQISADGLTVGKLLSRIEAGGVTEVILATNSTFEGDTTALYLAKLLSRYPGLKVSRLAYGIPVGGYLEYADDVTLDRAIRGRTPMAELQ